jgi:hypothetical protein
MMRALGSELAKSGIVADTGHRIRLHSGRIRKAEAPGALTSVSGDDP